MEFRILGPLEVVEDGRPVSIRRGKEQALLAYLLLHANEVVPSGRLIDALWDERPPPTASKILQNAVSHLRKELGDGRLLTRDPGYVLRVEKDELDLQRFEQLAKEGRGEDALALWRGPALLDLRDERFADDARRRLEDQRLAVLEDRIERDLAAGRHPELVAELEQLVAENPLRERLQGQLMRALYANGRQADALDVYRRARKTLSEELGLEPGPQLQELERKILNQDPELRPDARAPSRVEVAPPLTRAEPRGPALLLGAQILPRRSSRAATGGSGGPLLATKNSLAVVDPNRNRVVEVIPIGPRPRGVTVGREFVWTANAGEGTVTQIDPRNSRSSRRIGLGLEATDLVEARGGVWVATGNDNNIVRLDARSGGESQESEVSDFRSAYVADPAGRRRRRGLGFASDLFQDRSASHGLAGRWHYGRASTTRRQRRLRMARQHGETVARLGDDRPSDRGREHRRHPDSACDRQRLDLGCRAGPIRSSRGRLGIDPATARVADDRLGPAGRALPSHAGHRPAREGLGRRASTQAQSPDSIPRTATSSRRSGSADIRPDIAVGAEPGLGDGQLRTKTARRGPARKPASSSSGMISVSPTGSLSKRSTARRFFVPPPFLTCSTSAVSATRSQSFFGIAQRHE